MRAIKIALFLSASVLLLLSGCSTTNHAPIYTMVYHDITSHYNAYFNANEKLKGVYLSLDKAHKDNYKDIIAPFTYSDPKEAGAMGADLDDVEKRCTQSVQLHKISNWADDHFLLMAKANYIKGDYGKAQNFLKYLTTEYKNGVDYVKERKKMGKTAKPTLKKKPAKKPKFVQKLDEKGNLVLTKVDERPHYSWWIHEPARAEALLWLAKTYSADKKYTEAAAVIQYARSDDKFYADLDKYIEITDAENLLRQKNYRDAIIPLEKFIGMTKRKKERLRPIFILAQIYELQGNNAKAAYYYKEVLKNRPGYDMEFYAKLNHAKLGRKSGGSNEEIKKLLAKMSRDGKYKDFLDQICYELGEIVLSENNRADARKDFRKSIKFSTSNADQKALSFLALAQMDYEEEIYVSAKHYYDSTLLSMAKTDTGYNGVEKRAKTLEKLVAAINTIYTEDSLQRIARMSEGDRRKFINKLITAQEREAELNSDQKSTNGDFVKPPSSNSATNTSEGEGTFYFYNTIARSAGYNEFIKKFGRRKLEENWRRKDKASATPDATADSDSTKSKTGAKDSTTAVEAGSDMEKMLVAVPLTPDKLQKSNEKLIDAYYAMGTAYKDDLESYRKATNAFEDLNKRFQKHKLQLESYYQLYLLYTRTKNPTKADYYRNIIISDYPNSIIAKSLQDPNFLVELKKKENALSYYYESAYNDYASGMYASVEKKCLEVDVQFKENKMRAKFDLLNAMALSKENRLDDFVQALNKIIGKYPNTPEKDQAQAWLTGLNHSKLPQLDISKQPKSDSAFGVLAPLADTTSKNTASLKTEEPKTYSIPQSLLSHTDTAKVPAKTTADSSHATTALPTPPPVTNKPVAKDSTIAKPALKDSIVAVVKPYKPLSRTERLDSIIKAEKAAKNKPKETTTISKPTNNNSTVINATTGNNHSGTTNNNSTNSSPAATPIDTSHHYTALDTTKKSAPKPKIAVKDSISKKPVKPLVKDSIVKKPTPKPVIKDSVVKPTPKPVAKDTPKVAPKPIAKDTAKLVSKPAPIVASLPSFDTDSLASVYGKSDSAPHFVLIYFLDPAAFNIAITSKIDNFNSTAYSDLRYTTRAVFLDKDNKLIHVKTFKDNAAAQTYIVAMKAKLETLLPGITTDKYFMGAIASLNYSTLLTTKKINNYIHFYRVNYK